MGAVAVVAALLGASTASHLTSSDDQFQDRNSESFRTLQLLTDAGGVVPGPSVFVVTRAADTRRAIALLRREPTIATATVAGRSRDGYVLVSASFRASSGENGAVARRLARTVPGDVGGVALANDEVQRLSESDLFRAEMIAFPVLFLLALWVFRGLVAALLPLAAGAVSIVTTLALLRLVNTVSPVSVFALNLVTGAGLGLAIDYSLLLVSRYREELVLQGPGEAALRTTMATAGRTVAFSAVTVAAAFASLFAFPLGFLRSMAAGGVIVVPLAGLVALTVLPALFALLGERVNALPVGRIRVESRGWYRFSHWVMRRPLPIAVCTATLLILLGLPFLSVRFEGVSANVLPKSSNARVAEEALHAHFPPGTDAPLHVAIFRASPASTVAAIQTLPTAAVGRPQRLGPRLWSVEVVPRGGANDASTKRLVREVRRLPDVAVAGRTAWYLDTARSLLNHLPVALVILAVTIMLLLFLVTRSVVLPVKSLIMNLLGLSAAFGILVTIFGTLELTQPALLFAIAFGLSTDYAVFLLSRIREAHDAGLGNREAVALGLERTGRVVTAAALLFCIAVLAFATSRILVVRQLGVGIALAVAIDATLIRALLVPSLMALLGDWNWWRPGLRRR